LTVRSAAGDRTAKAVIRDEALRLFAAAGPDAVTIRQIAAAAGVSPGLVVHHFGSKEGLRMAVDEKVASIFDVLFEQARGEAAALRPGSAASLAELMVRELPADSAVPAYLRRLLLAGDEAGRALVRRWFDSSHAMIEELGAAGVIRAGDSLTAAASTARARGPAIARPPH
jgi:AcrR family transcriptional regulator